jgi:glutathione S-transferase
MPYRYTAIVTLLMVITYMVAGFLVGAARGKHGVKAPATEGPDAFNRVYRAHMNTLEQLVAMLPALWLFAITVGDQFAGALGLVWVVGRILYIQAYAVAAEKRGFGFMVSFIALVVAVLGSLGSLLWQLAR